MGQVFEKFVQPDEILLDGILSMHCSWLTTGCVDDDYITSGALHFACEYSSIENTRPRQLIMDPFCFVGNIHFSLEASTWSAKSSSSGRTVKYDLLFGGTIEASKKSVPSTALILCSGICSRTHARLLWACYHSSCSSAWTIRVNGLFSLWSYRHGKQINWKAGSFGEICPLSGAWCSVTCVHMQQTGCYDHVLRCEAFACISEYGSVGNKANHSAYSELVAKAIENRIKLQGSF